MLVLKERKGGSGEGKWEGGADTLVPPYEVYVLFTSSYSSGVRSYAA